MGTDCNPGIDGIGPKRGVKLIQEFGKAEGALEKLGEEIDNLDEIRSLFLEHPFVDFTQEWNTPNVESTFSYLCNDYSFNKSRVEKALEQYVEAKPRASHFHLGVC